jgi:four helix bundle protein
MFFLIKLNRKMLFMKENLIKRKSFEFAVLSIRTYKKLIEQKEFVVSKQFVRSATSIGANVQEADAGISKKDFIAKMSIASKEARETLYWIQLLKETELVNFNFDELKQKCEEIVRILTSIVKTSQLNIKH